MSDPWSLLNRYRIANLWKLASVNVWVQVKWKYRATAFHSTSFSLFKILFTQLRFIGLFKGSSLSHGSILRVKHEDNYSLSPWNRPRRYIPLVPVNALTRSRLLMLNTNNYKCHKYQTAFILFPSHDWEKVKVQLLWNQRLFILKGLRSVRDKTFFFPSLSHASEI